MEGGSTDRRRPHMGGCWYSLEGTLWVSRLEMDLPGLSFLEGIPGSLGGALRMNAGAMGGVDI